MKIKVLLLPVSLLFTVNCLFAQLTLDKTNPHYFNYNGNAIILTGSTEHYGAVINKAFDYKKYITTLKKTGLNHTRIFLGDYFEKDSAFCILHNTLSPKYGDLLCPWSRSNKPGYSLGGNKFDLDKWDDEYFARLDSFMGYALKNDIIVEAVLFFASWTLENSPLYFKTNINNTDRIKANEYMTFYNGNILKRQKEYCIKLVTELNKFDNLIINIANEPWFDNQEHPGFASPPPAATKKWIKEVSEWIVETEKHLPNKHLISVDYSNEGEVIPPIELNTYFKNISAFNHHYDKNARSVQLNYKNIDRAFTFNETGLMPVSTPQYRIQGWKYIMCGGAMYDNLDFTFQVGYEDGSGHSGFSCEWYSGCDDTSVKYEMANLSKFANSIDFTHMKPDYNVIIVSYGDENVYPLVNPGKEYAVYFTGGKKAKLMLSIPNGTYEFKWINPADLKNISTNTQTIEDGRINLSGPEYEEDILLYVKKE